MAKTQTDEIKPVFDYDKMKEICLAPIEFFSKYGDEVKVADGLRYFFKDNGANILAVAHLDSVDSKKHFHVVKTRHKSDIIFNPQLDDRAGAYVILEMLPKCGVQADFLLTEGEESGRTTARQFKTTKKYNWIFEFDRMGWDVVLYSFHDAATVELLEQYDFVVGHGSFSDIGALTGLGCKAFNFGVGYHDYHGDYSHLFTHHTLHNVTRFLKFYEKMKDTHLSHTPSPERWSRTYYPRRYDDYSDAGLGRSVRSSNNDNELAMKCGGCSEDLISDVSKRRGYCYSCTGKRLEGHVCYMCCDKLLSGSEKLTGLCDDCRVEIRKLAKRRRNAYCFFCEEAELTTTTELYSGVCAKCVVDPPCTVCHKPFKRRGGEYICGQCRDMLTLDGKPIVPTEYSYVR